MPPRQRLRCPDTVLNDYAIGSIIRVRRESSVKVMDEWDPANGVRDPPSSSSDDMPEALSAASDGDPGLTVDLRILAVQQPPTLAVVCLIEVLSSVTTGDRSPCRLPPTLVCKFYDRRHALNIRQDYKQVEPFSSKQEQWYL